MQKTPRDSLKVLHRDLIRADVHFRSLDNTRRFPKAGEPNVRRRRESDAVVHRADPARIVDVDVTGPVFLETNDTAASGNCSVCFNSVFA